MRHNINPGLWANENERSYQTRVLILTCCTGTYNVPSFIVTQWWLSLSTYLNLVLRGEEEGPGKEVAHIISRHVCHSKRRPEIRLRFAGYLIMSRSRNRWTLYFLVCHATLFHQYPVSTIFESKPRDSLWRMACEPQTYFRSSLLSTREKEERSNDRKYVCGSQVMW